MSNVDMSGCVLVPIERLRALEALEADIPNVIAKAKEEANAERFAALRARDLSDPAGHAKRSAEWKKAHREEYNAKRREQYKLKKDSTKSPDVGDAAAPPH
ncbi:hypothetical protein EBR43_09595 [bacterium]|nr:hypothetical protein [bacterium]